MPRAPTKSPFRGHAGLAAREVTRYIVAGMPVLDFATIDELRRRVTQIHASTLQAERERHLVVDIREGYEVAAGTLQGALHVPVRELEARLDELRPPAGTDPVRVVPFR